MKKAKPFFTRLPVYLILLAFLGIGIWKFLSENGLPEELQNVIPTEASTVPAGIPPEELINPVDRVIRLGEVFSMHDETYTGHLEGKITAARLVTDSEDCPKEWCQEGTYLYGVGEDGQTFDLEYDQWFTPDGALDQGAKLVRLDMEITNVDAAPSVRGGYPFFLQEDLFQCNFVIGMTDLQDRDQYKNMPRFDVIGFSQRGQYASQDDPDTLGAEDFALCIPQGETVQVSMVIGIDNLTGGKLRDPAYLFAYAGTGEFSDTGMESRTYINLNLEEIP